MNIESGYWLVYFYPGNTHDIVYVHASGTFDVLGSDLYYSTSSQDYKFIKKIDIQKIMEN